MNFFFGYIYYRITKYYLTADRKWIDMGVNILSFIQMLWIYLYVMHPLIRFCFSAEYRAQYNKGFGLAALIPLGALIWINSKIYPEKYDDYNRCWGNENIKTKLLKGVAIVVFLASPLFPLYIPWVRHTIGI